MNPSCIITIIVLLILLWIEYRYSPRIDVTKKGDLWYTMWDGYRHFKFLFKIKK
jgi:hypothetical protein